MGGNSSGPFSVADMKNLSEEMERKIQETVTGSTSFLFACQSEDLRSLASHIRRFKELEGRHNIVDEKTGHNLDNALSTASMVVTFTDTVSSTIFLSSIAEHTLSSGKRGIHVKALPSSHVPAKVAAYRWPSMLWDEFEIMFRGG